MYEDVDKDFIIALLSEMLYSNVKHCFSIAKEEPSFEEQYYSFISKRRLTKKELECVKNCVAKYHKECDYGRPGVNVIDR